MFAFLNKPINFTLPFPVMVVILVLAVARIVTVTSVERNVYFGHFLLGVSLFVSIGGFAIAVSKKERERTRLRVLKELPDRAELINAPESDKRTQRNGFLGLILGLILFSTWCYFYGLESMSTF